MDDLKDWPVLADIKLKVFSSIETIYVFGRSGREVMFVTKDDDVYAMGLNNRGCLGFGHIRVVKQPAIVAELCHKKIKTFISSFYNADIDKYTFALALTKFGDLYSWGSNEFANLGYDSSIAESKPKLITALSGVNVVDVCCGRSHCLALSDSGEVYAWGYNKYGQCGTGGEETATVKPTKILGLTGHRVVSIVCGGNHSLALTDSGELYGWGTNKNGQLGNDKKVFQRSPSKLNLNENVSIKKISAGSVESMILSCEGEVYVFNATKYNQIEGQVLPLNLGFKVIDILSAAKYEVSILMSEALKCYVLNDYKYPTVVPETTMNEAFNSFINVKVTLKPVTVSQLISSPVKLEKQSHSFDNEKYSDIAFKIDGKSIYAQKLFLRSVCRYFDNMFGDNAWLESNTNEIAITQYSYSVFYAFLKYLYTNRLEIKFTAIIDLLDLANSYLEDELKNKCVEYIKRNIDVENVCHFYSVAVKYDLNDLENFCFDFATIDMSKVFNTKGYKEELNANTTKIFFAKYVIYATRKFANTH